MSRPSHIKRGSTRHSDDTVDDDLSVSLDGRDDTKRKSRNLSEKRRRDQFNLLINELNVMVSTDTRKMDKSTVLKSTISFLKNHNESSVKSLAYEIGVDWKPSFLTNEQFAHLILEAIDGFILVFSVSGQILYASENITSLLGHLPRDLAKETMYDLVHENDHSQLYNLVLTTGCLSKQSDGKETQVVLSCHMKRGVVNQTKISSYELVQFQGFIRSNASGSMASDASFCLGDMAPKLVFVGTGKLYVPLLMPDISSIDASKSEFSSRHSLEWKFLFLDHRASPIIGYLPFEVLGTSGYDYYHVDDLDNVVACHEALINKGEGTSCHYRFLMKGQQWIWLQTRFYITYHQWNSKPEFIVCTHRVVSCVEVFRHHRDDADPCDEEEEEDDDDDDEEPDEMETSCATKPPHAAAWPDRSAGAASALSYTDTRTFRILAPSSRSCTYAPAQKVSPAAHPSNASTSPAFASPAVDRSSTFLDPLHYVAVTPLLGPSLGIAPAQPNVQASMLTPTLMVSRSQCQVQSPVLAAPLVMTCSQAQTQEQLQRKHQQLQALIQAQQEELRRVSEQLLMAQFGTANSTPTLCPVLQTGDLLSPGVVLDTTDGNVVSTPEQLNLHGQSSSEGGTPNQLPEQQAQLLFPSLATNATKPTL